MSNREKIEEKFSELRNFADKDDLLVVGPDNWNVYSKLRDLIDESEKDILALMKDQLEGKVEETRGEWPDETLPVSCNKERECPSDHS